MFTPEELAEMARADAEIEASFRLTPEDLSRSRNFDKRVVLEAMPRDKRRKAEYQKAYYEANREKVAEYQKAYKEANREKLAEYQKAYKEANREKLAEYQKAYYEANREKLAEYQKAIRIARKGRGYTQKHLARLIGVSQPLLSRWETGKMPADLDKLIQVLPEIKEAARQSSASALCGRRARRKH